MNITFFGQLDNLVFLTANTVFQKIHWRAFFQYTEYREKEGISFVFFVAW